MLAFRTLAPEPACSILRQTTPRLTSRRAPACCQVSLAPAAALLHSNALVLPSALSSSVSQEALNSLSSLVQERPAVSAEGVVQAGPSLQASVHCLVDEVLGEEEAEGTPGAAVREDVCRKAHAFLHFTGGSGVKVRLALLRDHRCPRLHVDHVRVRGLCTYSGPTTEYVEEGGEDRRQLWGLMAPLWGGDPGGFGLRPGAKVRRPQTGELLLLRGEDYPRREGRGAVHRSPEATAASPRLLLTLDEVEPEATEDCACCGENNRHEFTVSVA